MNGAAGQCGEGIPVFRAQYKPLYLYNIKMNLVAHYNVLKGANILAFSGLGDNRSFFNLLEGIGAHVLHEMPFPDHYAYKTKDMKRLLSFKDVDAFVTTEKDAVKIEHMEVSEHLFYLAIEVVIEREQELMDYILKKIGNKKSIYN